MASSCTSDELLDKSPSVASLMSVPLLAVLISQVFESAPDLLLSTRTQLYSSLVLLVVRHVVNENRIAVSEVEREILKAAKDIRQLREGVAKTLLTDHAKIAWLAHKEDKAIFDTSFIRNEAGWESLAPLAVGLLDSNYSTGGDRTEVRQYSFQHLSFQEFLAEKISDDNMRERSTRRSWWHWFLRRRVLKKTLKDLCKDTHSYTVLQFLAGLMEKKFHSVFFLTSTSGYTTLNFATAAESNKSVFECACFAHKKLVEEMSTRFLVN